MLTGVQRSGVGKHAFHPTILSIVNAADGGLVFGGLLPDTGPETTHRATFMTARTIPIVPSDVDADQPGLL